MKNPQEGSRKPSAAFISPCALKCTAAGHEKFLYAALCLMGWVWMLGAEREPGGREAEGNTSRDLHLDLNVSSRTAQISARTPPPVCSLKELSFTYVVDALGEFVCGDVYVFFFLI